MGEQKNQKTQDVNQLLKIRRDKLAELQADGKDPFQITKFDVTHHSQEVKDQFEDLEGKSVVLAGRMMSKRVMKSIFLQYPGSAGQYPVLCGKRQHR